MATKIQPQDIDTTQTFVLSASQFSNGSASSPAITFSSDITTGIFRSGANSIGMTLGGTQIIEFDPGVITPGSDNTVALGSTSLGWTRLFMKAGTSSLPSYTFRDFSTTGLYIPGANSLGFTVTGENTATLYSSSLTSNKRGVLYLNDLANEDGTSLFIGFGERTVTYSGNESGWLDLSKGDAAGTYLGAHNQIRLVAGANVQASTSYTSKDNTGRYFVLSPNPFSDDSQPIPGRTFTIGANTYTVRQYRNANSRLFVYEDISGEAASGTLTNVTYATTSFMAAANQVRVQDGSAGSPSISFLNQTNTGIFRIGTSDLGFSAGGTEYLRIGNTGAAGAVHSSAVGGFSNVINSPGNPAVFYAINNDNTNGNSHSVFEATTGGTSSGDPYTQYQVPSGATWSVGIDNSDSRKFKISGGTGLGANDTIVIDSSLCTGIGGISVSSIFGSGLGSSAEPKLEVSTGSTTETYNEAVIISHRNTSANAVSRQLGLFLKQSSEGSSNESNKMGGLLLSTGAAFSNSPSLYFVAANTAWWGVTQSGVLFPAQTSSVLAIADGTSANPSIQFNSQSNTGFHRPTTSQISMDLGGTTSYLFAPTVLSVIDNTTSLGQSGNRWTAVWAVNGTIQTSHSSTKTNIVELDPASLELPKGVMYDRDGRRWLGYLNDSIPDEGRPVGDALANYEQAVIGILCAKLQKATDDIENLKQQIVLLQSK